MEVNRLYITAHTYGRLVERTTKSLNWSNKRYDLRGYCDFLFKFLDELFKEDVLPLKRKSNEYVGEVNFFELKLDVIIYPVDENGVYIPTVFLKEYEKKFDSELTWQYPVKIIPRRPTIRMEHPSGRLEIQLSTSQLLKALLSYSLHNPKVRLEIEAQEIKSKNKYYACQLA